MNPEDVYAIEYRYDSVKSVWEKYVEHVTSLSTAGDIWVTSTDTNYGKAIVRQISDEGRWLETLRQGDAWVTKVGNTIPITQMDVMHVSNTIKLLERLCGEDTDLTRALAEFIPNNTGNAMETLHKTPLMEALVAQLIELKWNLLEDEGEENAND
jgi:hypothetical protein